MLKAILNHVRSCSIIVYESILNLQEPSKGFSMSLHELVRNPSKGSSRTFQIRFMISLRYSSGALRTLPEFFQNTFEIFTRIIQELFMNSPGTPQKLFRCSSGALQELLGDTSGILQELFKNSARTLQKGRGRAGSSRILQARCRAAS